jgi:hypothetical protein
LQFGGKLGFIPIYSTCKSTVTLFVDLGNKIRQKGQNMKNTQKIQNSEIQQSTLSFADHPDYHDALDFAKKVRINEAQHYDWVWEYSKDLWTHRVKVIGLIDEKAESIIKYLGGGLGIVSLGIIAIPTTMMHLALWMLPAIFCAIVSIAYALYARWPKDMPALPSIKEAIEYTDHYIDNDNAKAHFLGQWNLACEGIRLFSSIKAKNVEWAMKLCLISISLLSLPIIVGILNNFSGICFP